MQSIRSAISEEEQKCFYRIETPNILLKELESLCSSNQRDQRRLLSCCAKFAAFSNSFAPYFDIVALFVRIKPEWLVCFWGSIKLVFQVVTHLPHCKPIILLYFALPNKSVARKQSCRLFGKDRRNVREHFGHSSSVPTALRYVQAKANGEKQRPPYSSHVFYLRGRYSFLPKCVLHVLTWQQR